MVKIKFPQIHEGIFHCQISHQSFMLDSLELLESEIHKKLNDTNNWDFHLNLQHMKYNHKVVKGSASHDFT